MHEQQLTTSVFKLGSHWQRRQRKDSSLERVERVVMKCFPPTFNRTQSRLPSESVVEADIGRDSSTVITDGESPFFSLEPLSFVCILSGEEKKSIEELISTFVCSFVRSNELQNEGERRRRTIHSTLLSRQASERASKRRLHWIFN